MPDQVDPNEHEGLELIPAHFRQTNADYSLGLLGLGKILARRILCAHRSGITQPCEPRLVEPGPAPTSALRSPERVFGKP